MQQLAATREAPERASSSSRSKGRLRAEDARWAAELPLEIAFLAAYGVAPDALLLAARKAAQCRAWADQALLNEGLLQDEDFYRLLARHVRAPLYSGEIPVAETVDPIAALADGRAPLAPNEAGLRYLVAPRGEAVRVLARAAQAGLRPEGMAIASPRQFRTAVHAAAGARIAETGAFALKAQDAALSAHRRLSAGQVLAAICVAGMMLALSTVDAELPAAVASMALAATFGSSIVLRLWAAAMSAPAPREQPVGDRDLPIFSIVVALHREANIVDQLIAALDAIDYPRAKLDVTIVLEQGDEATLRALERLRLAARYNIVVAPAGEPRTKPRALNIALPSVRGRYVVVYDAEDKPARDQLRRAVARFNAEPEIGCLQARLAVERPDESWLAALFAIEYSALFDVINPGLAALRTPMALGGSSNHFQTDVLRRLGGWDAWNVTEDADLGLRLARFGVRVATLDSDTQEEAPPNLRQWLAQRRRWHKGWLQTALVHSRDPARIVREIGLLRAWSAASLMAGAIVGAMFGPLFTAHALWRCLSGDLFASRAPIPLTLGGMSVAVLVAGLVSILAPTMIGLRRRGLLRLVWAAALLPFYYCLISLAAWLALYDLIWRPFHWFKTEHGARRAPAPAAAWPLRRLAIDIGRRLPTVRASFIRPT